MERRSILKSAMAVVLAPFAMFHEAKAIQQVVRPVKRWVGIDCYASPEVLFVKFRQMGQTMLCVKWLINYLDTKNCWNNPDNWSPYGVPTKDDDVVIASEDSKPMTIELNGIHYCKTMTIDFSDSTVSFNGSGTVVRKNGDALVVRAGSSAGWSSPALGQLDQQ